MKNEPKGSFPGLGCGYLWNVTCKELELPLSVLYCFCASSPGFGLLRSRADLQQPSSLSGPDIVLIVPTSDTTLNSV